MADTKHLKKRGETWYVVVKVPKALTDIIGKTDIVKSLGTKDLREAQHQRHKYIAQIKESFDIAESNRAALSNKPADEFVRWANDLRQQIKQGEVTEEQVELETSHMIHDFIDDNFPREDDGESIIDQESVGKISAAIHLVQNTGHTLSESVRDYLAELEERVRPSTLSSRKRRLKAFSDWLKRDMLITDINRSLAGKFVTEHVVKLQLAPKTKRDFIGDITSFFMWCMDRGLTDNNPFERMSKTIKETTRGGQKKSRKAWNEKELLLLIDNVKEDKKYLAMSSIALFTGMRLNEIAETVISDVHLDYIYIPEGKTESAVRKVPLHPIIKPFVKYLKDNTSDEYLIEGLKRGGEDNKRGHYFSKYFTKKRQRAGVSREGVVFHSLRNTFITACENAGMLKNFVHQIVGHADNSESFDTYSGGVKLKVLLKEMSRVSFGKSVDEATGTVIRSLGNT